MEDFIKRDEERILIDAWEKSGFSFGVVFGRRRVGKTTLLHSFICDKRAIYFQASKDKDDNLIRFSRAIGKTLFSSPDITPYTSFSVAFSTIAEHAGNERLALIIDEVSYLAESDKSVLSVLQSFVDNDFKHTGIFLVLSASNMSFMESDVLGINSPLYGRRTFQIKLLPFTFKESAEYLKNWSVEDIATAHVITGGVPYYLSLLKEHKNLKEAISKEFFSMSGRLFTEGRLYLMMELRNIELYDSILYLIASGVNGVSEIADKSRKDKSSISQALTKLSAMGLTRKRKKIAGKGTDRGWVIIDSFFLFFYRYVFPFSEMIELSSAAAAIDKAIKELPSFTGRGMEEVLQRYVLLHSGLLIREIGNVKFPDPVLKRNEEIDLVAYASENQMLFGECKWLTHKIGIDCYEELKRRSDIAYPSIQDKTYYILSRSGFTDELVRASEESDGKLLLVSKEDLLS